MLNRSARKIPPHYKERGPTRHKKHSTNDTAGTLQVPAASWLPHHTSDYAAWGVAADRAHRELEIANGKFRRQMGDDALRRSVDLARQLWYYTMEHVYPPGFWEGMADLRAGCPDNLEMYIVFLENDPRFFRSGYTKSDVIRGVKRMSLTSAQQYRLQQVVLHVVDKGFRREFRDYCRLARYIQSPGFLVEVEERMSSSDPNHILRAKWVLDACLKP